MRIVEFGPDRGAEVTRFGATGVRGVPLVRSTELGRYAVTVLHLAPGGSVGRHEARVDQLFAVVSGAGWVSGADGERRAVQAGQAAVFDADEEHDAGTEGGLVAVVVESDDLSDVT